MIEELSWNLHYLPQTILISILFLIAFVWCQENRGQSLKKLMKFIIRNRWIAFFLIYSAFLFTCTILARKHTNPFANIIGHIELVKNNGKYNINAIQNVLLFIPYTLLFAAAFKKKHFIFNSILLTTITTAFIEVFQLVFWLGEFSLADMAHNMSGGIIGIAIWFTIKSAAKIIGHNLGKADNNKQSDNGDGKT